MSRPHLTQGLLGSEALFPLKLLEDGKWRDPGSNRGHHDFQSCALPAELSRLVRLPILPGLRFGGIVRTDNPSHLPLGEIGASRNNRF